MAQRQWAKKRSNMSVLSYHQNRQITDDLQFTNQFLSRRFASSEGLFRKNLTGHFGCINAIEFSNKGGNFLASGGDDRRIVLWNMQDAISNVGSAHFNNRSEGSRNNKLQKKLKAVTLRGEHHSNIFSLAFDSQNKNIFSGGNDAQVLVHDMQTGETKDVFLHEDAVFGVVIDPCNDNVFASAGDDGRVLIWDIREPSHHEPFVLANYATSFHAVVYHPMESRFLATANCKEGLALWDVRKPRSSLLRYGGVSQQSAMSVCFDHLGRRLLGLRRRLPPVLYDLHNSVPTYQFDHSGYYNSCTMKTGCFAGDKHQYVVSGSDDFNLYVWQVPEGPVEEGWVGEAHMVLQGHRSIVNQVCFNHHTHMIASSGVEKLIKLWSPFALPDSRGNVRGDQDLWEVDRPMYNRGEYLNLMMNSSTALSYDYSNQSMEEDPRMIAFFDSLVQREVDGGFSDSSDSYVSTDQMLLSVTDFQLIDVDNQSDSDSLSPDTTIILQLERQQQESTAGHTERQQPKVGSSGESQEPSTIDSLPPSGSSHGTKRTAADSSSSDSDLTDTDEEGRRLFERYCAKQRELYRKNRRRKRVKQTNQQVDSNKLVSLRQRLACKKALKHKMHKKSTKTSSVKIVIGSASSDEEEETVRTNTLPPVQNAPTAHQNSVRSLRRRIAFVRNQDDLDCPKTETRDCNINTGNEGHSSSDTAGKEQSTSGVNAGSDSEDQPSCSWDVSHHERGKTQSLQAQLSFENENKDSDNNADNQEFKRKQKKSKRQYRSNKRD